MDKGFWDGMASIWCRITSKYDIERAEDIAKEQAKKDNMSNSGYSVSLWDDFDDEEDGL